ncbi:aryl-sulfate sulfotransferase [Ruminococcaceae bacterium OttesenSCG-928-L11]|nr:aryl-sulfate sulfotransferase [Ruminococcaceae bacterium OttesenSCG-928-L11]
MGNYSCKPILESIKVNGQFVNPSASADIPVLESSIHNPYGKNLLSFNMNFTFSRPLKYSYRVHGKTSDVDFTYAVDTYTLNPVVPVIGIYATGTTTITFLLTDDNAVEYEIPVVTDDFTSLDIGVHLREISIELLDDAMVEATIGNGWLFNDLMNGYDKNGDLRVTGFTGPVIHFPQFSAMKIHNNAFYVQSEHTAFYYSQRYDRYNMMGKLLNSYIAPENYGFHHDITWDNQGYVYILGSPLTDEDPLRAGEPLTRSGTVIRNAAESDLKREGTVYKYREDTGELVTSIEYSGLYDGTATIADSVPNDVHFNTITYIPEIDQLVINSRNSCTYMGVDKRTLLPCWIVDNPNNPVPDMPETALLLPEMYNLTVVNPGDFVYTNGTHCTLVTYNEKYESYRGENKIVMSLLDNVACKDPDGKDIMVLQEQAQEITDAGYNWDTAVQIVAIDLNNRTVESLDRFTMAGERSRVTSCVFDSVNKKYFQVYHGVPANFFVIDTYGKVGVRARSITANHEWSYRAIIWSYDQIRDMIATGL